MQGATFDLKAWNVVGDANWTVSGDVVQADKGSGFLVTAAAYGDFEVSVEIWVNDEANSGAFIRCSDPKTISATNAYEVNVFGQTARSVLSDRRDRERRQAARHDQRGRQMEHAGHHRQGDQDDGGLERSHHRPGRRGREVLAGAYSVAVRRGCRQVQKRADSSPVTAGITGAAR